MKIRAMKLIVYTIVGVALIRFVYVSWVVILFTLSERSF